MRDRGFTLIEMAVTIALSAIVLAGAVVLVTATQRMLTTGAGDRAMQETARVALGELTAGIRSAGYGLEPNFAVDFGQATTNMDRLPAGQDVRFGGFACDGNVTCRDSVAGPDEIVFYTRDPTWMRELNGPAAAGSIKLAGDLSALSPGQILQLMCYGVGNQWQWAFVTVSKVTTSSGTVEFEENTGLPNDFPHQNTLAAGTCFASGQRRAFKIDRYRYYVAAFDDAGAARAWGTPGARPYLMLDQGLKDGDNPIVNVIAADVEDLQVAYVFPLAGTTATAQLVGATGGTRLAQSADGIDLVPDSTIGIPRLSTPTQDPTRTTHHPANLRAIRVAVTVRSQLQDPSIDDAAVPAMFNRPAIPAEAGYRRLVFESATDLPNMDIRLPVFPIYDPSYTTASCTGWTGNCGGG